MATLNNLTVKVGIPQNISVEHLYKNFNVVSVVTCIHPGEISKGMLTSLDFKFGQSVTYQCDVGTSMDDGASAMTLTCLANGRWDKTPNDCRGM